MQKKQKVYIGLLFLILLGSISLLWFFLRQPAIGNVQVGVDRTEQKKIEDKKQKEYRGEYITFSYPGAYKEKYHEIPVNGPVKESILLSSDSVSGGSIALVVERRESEGFGSSPSFQMRVNKPKEYEREDFSKGGHVYAGVLFRKNSSLFERTFFFNGTSFVLTVSVTSSENIGTLEPELFAVIDSLRFLQ